MVLFMNTTPHFMNTTPHFMNTKPRFEDKPPLLETNAAQAIATYYVQHP
jgi:hypothetical protein